MFDRISSTYDRINRILSFGMDRRWRKKVAEFLPQRPHLQILDLATGTGDQIAALLDHKATFTGIDLSEEMLRLAHKKIGRRARFVHGNAEELPFENHTFDAATFSFGIRNVNDPHRSLQEIHRVLKQKGRCLILEFSLPSGPLRRLYLFYLRHILPRIGGLLSRKPDAYRYLNQTIETFPSGKAFCAWMKEAGFASVHTVPMAFGGVTLYVGEKE